MSVRPVLFPPLLHSQSPHFHCHHLNVCCSSAFHSHPVCISFQFSTHFCLVRRVPPPPLPPQIIITAISFGAKKVSVPIPLQLVFITFGSFGANSRRKSRAHICGRAKLVYGFVFLARNKNNNNRCLQSGLSLFLADGGDI